MQQETPEGDCLRDLYGRRKTASPIVESRMNPTDPLFYHSIHLFQRNLSPVFINFSQPFSSTSAQCFPIVFPDYRQSDFSGAADSREKCREKESFRIFSFCGTLSAMSRKIYEIKSRNNRDLEFRSDPRFRQSKGGCSPEDGRPAAASHIPGTAGEKCRVPA